MEKIYNWKSNNYLSFLRTGLMLCLFIFSGLILMAQEENNTEDKPVRATFNSTWLIDNQSVTVPIKGTFEFDILHRFGTLGDGFDNFFGLYAASNMRLGFSYAPINNLSLGFGLTKNKHLLDLNAKYAIFQQTRSGKVPVSVTYFGNMGIDLRKDKEKEGINKRTEPLYHSSDRLSYFHQLIVARRFNSKLSLQLAASLSHYNMVQEWMKNDHIAVALGGKYNISETLACIFNVDQPVTKHQYDNPKPNLSLGLEIATSSHAFQVFIGNYSAILPQENNMFNQNVYYVIEDPNIPSEEQPTFGENLWDNFLIGFNITRLWNW